ncbi:MAG: hypothetical protein RL660_619 [Bacteroidota bacterium]
MTAVLKFIKPLLLLHIFFIVSCQSNSRARLKQRKDTIKVIGKDTIEHFVDSLSFGQKKRHKLEIYKVHDTVSTNAIVLLYVQSGSKWVAVDTVITNAVLINDINACIKDFNGDGFNDVVFTSGMANRGGNNIQTLLLYSKESNRLIWIKNSESYPNLTVNPKLKCINSFILTGGQTTCFLRLQGDSLIEFASVDQRDGRIVAEVIDKSGDRKIITDVIDSSGGFEMFINYDPVEVYTDN